MKKFKFVTILLFLAVFLFCGFVPNVEAATKLPDSVISDNHKVIEYIDNFRVVVKTADDGKYYIYCMNMTATYAGDIKFSKTGKVDDEEYICDCDCGTKGVIRTFLQLSGKEGCKNCGCVNVQKMKNLHDKTRRHGLSDTRIYGIYNNMIAR